MTGRSQSDAGAAGQPGARAAAAHAAGLAAHRSGDLAQAIALVSEATAADPCGRYFADLTELCRQARRLDEALAAGRRAIALAPDLAAAFNNLGVVCFERGAPDEAAAYYRRAVALAPDYVEAHSNLGNALAAAHRFEAAIAAYRRALEIAPGFADGWSNLGALMGRLGRRDEALAAYQAAVAADPLHGEGHTGLALQKLLRGDFDAGWYEYEWRWRSSTLAGRNPVRRPWGGDDLAGRRLLVHAEQGLGDVLQFSRYMAWLRQRGGPVTLRVPRPLARLLAANLGCAVVAADEPAPDFDVDCALMSLPLLLGALQAPAPADAPYLAAAPEAVAAWQGRVARPGRLSVGLAWAGNPKHFNDHNRSIAPARLRPLLEIAGVNWVSLQLAPNPEEFSPYAVLETRADIADFADTAAAVSALDLVICVDTALAHLAGALGRPCWVLLPVGCDWRWRVSGETSDWYPSLRLFRQASYGEWSPTIARVAGELRRLTKRGA
jgi:tetratricopeptide (TPR) repeat protein